MADSGMAALDAVIERMKLLGAHDVGARVALKAAPLIDAEIKKTAKAGTSPDGKVWKAKKDGGRPLTNAAAHIQTKAAGNYILTSLTGPDVFHHKGLGHAPRRQILPDTGKVPEALNQVLVQAAKDVFDEIMRVR